MLLRIAPAIMLLVGLAGCVRIAGDVGAACLEQHPGDVRCCYPGDHIDNGTCCPPGYHEVTDVDHPDWRACVLDEDPCADVGACLDAGADAP